MGRPTKGKASAAAKNYVSHSRFQKMYLDRVDELAFGNLSYTARQALIEAFEAGAAWQRRHVNYGRSNVAERKAGEAPQAHRATWFGGEGEAVDTGG